MLKRGGKLLALSAIMVATSCDYLDVAPPVRATLPDAMKDKNAAISWLQSCYEPLAMQSPSSHTRYESSTDEFVLPQLWGYGSQLISWNQMSAGGSDINNNTDRAQNRWYDCYGYIGHLHLFLSQLDALQPLNVTEEDRVRFKAEAKFVKAYLHFLLLELYGPIPIMDKQLPRDTPASEFPGRSHFDYCVDYIVGLLDEAAKELPSTYALDDTYNRGNAVICKALKARLLLYAASPLWNGSFPYPNWRNTNYETPGYGKELVSTKYDPKKWERALTACKEALEFAEKEGGRKLMDVETAMKMAEDQGVPLPSVPGVSADTPEGKDFLQHVLLMRYITASDETMGNKEMIWSTPDHDSNYAVQLPRRCYLRSNGQWWNGWSGIAPTLYSIEHFYTKDGVLPDKDKNFTPKEEWLKSAEIPGRGDIINLNVDREPRFYATFSFDGDEYGSLIRNGQPLTVRLRDKDQQGYNPEQANRDLCQTGFLSKKIVPPNIKFTDGGDNVGKWYPFPVIRLAELYLDVAECYEELGDTPNALKYLNVIRNRAGVRSLTTADITSDMPLREWVHNERFIELWFEGQRYYDVRRWMTAPKYLGAEREGLNSYEGRLYNPTFEQFNQRVKINQPFTWDNRMYLMPVRQNELYSNPQLVQAPGY